MEQIGQLCRKYNSFFHTDAAQAAGKLDINVQTMNLDALSISGHKLYGPKGVGILYVSSDARLKMRPLFDGGGQEKELRSGTLPTPLCVGIGEAITLGCAEKERTNAAIKSLRDDLLSSLTQSLEGLQINGSMKNRIHGNINMFIPGIDADILINNLPGIAISTGSACTSGFVEKSHVLSAIGLQDAELSSSFRIGIGKNNTKEEIQQAATFIIDAVKKLSC